MSPLYSQCPRCGASKAYEESITLCNACWRAVEERDSPGAGGSITITGGIGGVEAALRQDGRLRRQIAQGLEREMKLLRDRDRMERDMKVLREYGAIAPIAEPNYGQRSIDRVAAEPPEYKPGFRPGLKRAGKK